MALRLTKGEKEVLSTIIRLYNEELNDHVEQIVWDTNDHKLSAEWELNALRLFEKLDKAGLIADWEGY